MNKILFIPLFLILIFLVDCTPKEKETPESAENEWISLFDGESFNGWKEYNADSINPKWQVEDGMIIVSKEGNAREKNTGFGKSIITTQSFGNFELELEYRMSTGGNSGIMYHVIEDSKYNHDFATGPEYQILDDEFSATESLPNKMLGSSYDMFAPGPKTINPAGEWNKIKLIYENGRVEHWLNDEKVLEFTVGSEAWNEALSKSKWVDAPDWAKSTTGHISLQDHGDYVAFRNIRIREL